MSNESLLQRVETFEKNVATYLCIVPFLFSAQCFFAAVAAPIFEAMFADFGSKLPAWTSFVMQTWQLWAAVAVVVPILTLLVARKAKSSRALAASAAAGVLMFVIAQAITLALFLPIWQLGAVATDMK